MPLLDIGEFQHVSITCADPERSRSFYEDVLGFQLMDTRPPFRRPGYWLRRNNLILHLIGVPADEVSQHKGPWSAQDHLAFVVDDYEVALSSLKSAGIEVVESPSRDLGLLQLYFRDPDGHVIELDARGHYPGA